MPGQLHFISHRQWWPAAVPEGNRQVEETVLHHTQHVSLDEAEPRGRSTRRKSSSRQACLYAGVFLSETSRQLLCARSEVLLNTLY